MDTHGFSDLPTTVWELIPNNVNNLFYVAWWYSLSQPGECDVPF